MTPYYSDDLVTLYHGDCRALLIWDKGPAAGMGDLSIPWNGAHDDACVALRVAHVGVHDPIIHRPGCGWETGPNCTCGADSERMRP